jgi:hypothetical protein
MCIVATCACVLVLVSSERTLNLTVQIFRILQQVQAQARFIINKLSANQPYLLKMDNMVYVSQTSRLI